MLSSMGGTGRAADLVGRCGRRALHRAVAEGSVVRVARGRYALPDIDPATRAAAVAGGVLAGSSAASTYGWSTLHRPTVIEVAVPHGLVVPAQTGVRYRRRAIGLQERAAGRTDPLRTLVDCAAGLPFVDGLAVADAALRSGQVAHLDLLHAAAGHHGHGAAAVRRVARYADARADNALESGVRGYLLTAGFAGFVPQHIITGPGVFARVDLADPERRVAIETDGYAVHGDRRRFALDLGRHDELAALGWVTLRFAWEHVMFRPEWLVDQVRAVMRRRRRTGLRHRTTSGRSSSA